MFNEIYQYRELLKTNIKKEIRGKYKGSFLGVLWSFINPLLQVMVYAIVFPYLMRGTGDDYIVYLATGIIPWTFFQSTVVACMASVKVNAGIIKKVYFPREILPISIVMSGLINFFISCIIILIFCLAYGLGVSWHLVFVPVVALLQAILTLGFGFALAALTAYAHDLEYIVNFLLTLGFYGTPVVYKLEMFASNSFLITLVRYNPLTLVLNGYRSVFLYHQIPALNGLLILAVMAFAVLFIGYSIFEKLEKGFAEQY